MMSYERNVEMINGLPWRIPQLALSLSLWYVLYMIIYAYAYITDQTKYIFICCVVYCIIILRCDLWFRMMKLIKEREGEKNKERMKKDDLI